MPRDLSVPLIVEYPQNLCLAAGDPVDADLSPRGYEPHVRGSPHTIRGSGKHPNVNCRGSACQQPASHQATRTMGGGAAVLLAQSLSTALNPPGEACIPLRSFSHGSLYSHVFASARSSLS